jgi:hypothetical protein
VSEKIKAQGSTFQLAKKRKTFLLNKKKVMDSMVVRPGFTNVLQALGTAWVTDAKRCVARL